MNSIRSYQSVNLPQNIIQTQAKASVASSVSNVNYVANIQDALPRSEGNRLACIGRAFSCMRLLNPISLFKRHAAFVDDANSVAEAPKPTPDASASKDSSECRADDSSHGSSEAFPIKDIAVKSNCSRSKINSLLDEEFGLDPDSTFTEKKSEQDPVAADHVSVEKTIQDADSVGELPNQTLTTSELEITGTTTPNNSVCSEPSSDTDITFVEDKEDKIPKSGGDALASQQNGSQTQTPFTRERIEI